MTAGKRVTLATRRPTLHKRKPNQHALIDFIDGQVDEIVNGLRENSPGREFVDGDRALLFNVISRALREWCGSIVPHSITSRRRTEPKP